MRLRTGPRPLRDVSIPILQAFLCTEASREANPDPSATSRCWVSRIGRRNQQTSPISTETSMLGDDSSPLHSWKKNLLTREHFSGLGAAQRRQRSSKIL